MLLPTARAASPAEQHLPPVRYGHHPRRAVHVHPHEITVSRRRRPRMYPLPHTRPAALRPPSRSQTALNAHGAFHRIQRTIKNDEERVPSDVDLPTALGGNRLAHRAIVLTHHITETLAQTLEHPS